MSGIFRPQHRRFYIKEEDDDSGVKRDSHEEYIVKRKPKKPQKLLIGSSWGSNQESIAVSSTASSRTSESTETKNEAIGDFWVNYYRERRRLTKTKTTRMSNIRGSTLLPESDPHQIDIVDELERRDWETWWVRSPQWRRVDLFVIMLLVMVGFAQLTTSFYFFITASTDEKQVDPYVCTTKNCRYVSQRFKESINDSFSPCDNFYEFICGSYVDLHDSALYEPISQNQDPMFKSWNLHSAKLEFRSQNVLSEILKSYKKDIIHDQPIEYYKRCLEEEKRNEFGFTNMGKILRNIFDIKNNHSDWLDIGTRDSSYLANVAENFTRTIGSFGFFYYELEGYPNLLIVPEFLHWHTPISAENISKMLTMTFPELQKNSEILEKMSNGTVEILKAIKVTEEMSRNFNSCDSKQKFPFDIKKTLQDYTGSRGLEFIYWEQKYAKFIENLETCWSFKAKSDMDRNYAFVGFWTFNMILESLREISHNAFEALGMHLDGLQHYQHQKAYRNQLPEVLCFNSLTSNLGYVPVHRYFERLKFDATKFTKYIEDFFRTNVRHLHIFWKNDTLFPHIDSVTRSQGSKLLASESDPFYLISNTPNMEDIDSENSKALGFLNLGQDHLINALHGKMFTLRQAKKWWTEIDDKRHILLWNSRTFDLENAWYSVTPINIANAIFTPISFYLEPYDSDVLAVRNGGSKLICTRAMLTMMGAYIGVRQDNQTTPEGMKKGDGSTKPCWIQYFDRNSKELVVNTTMTFKTLYEEHFHVFANVLALKVVHVDSVSRKRIRSTKFWLLNNRHRTWVLSKKIVGLESYSEEQLFFMTAVRNFCRQKQHKGDEKYADYMQYVTAINAALQQMTEFATAFKCPRNFPMNPPMKCF